MWRLTKPASHEGNPVRRVFNLVRTALSTLLAVLFVTVLITATPVSAAGDASWNNGSIIYNDETYQGPVNSATLKILGLADKTTAYTYTDPEDTTTRDQADQSGSSSGNSPNRQMHVVYFAPGVDETNATSAQFKTFDFVSVTKVENPSSVQTISVDAGSYTEATAEAGSCQIPGGLGWLMCPLSNFLASSVDGIYGFLSDFFAVQPLVINSANDSLHVAWSIARSIANVAFIIVFLIIILAHVSNLQGSNYTLKKLMPRLIVAAVLVNVSFYICAIAIDVSNILGYSVQDVLMGVRESVFNGGDVTVQNAYEDWNWQFITTAILGGGGALAAFGLNFGGNPIGLIYAVIPILIAIGLTALFVLIVLAARQAIIVLLVIVAPLAFVAYLLPNTEKLFEKWRGLFMTMLIFFPAVSLVFGGSQLAAAVILQNSTSIIMMILGLAVQVAPLAITPLLLRFSGNLLGKIAGLVNDPRKGLLDRTKNWANSRVEARKYSAMGRFANNRTKNRGLVGAAHKELEEARAGGNQQTIRDAQKKYNRARARSFGSNLTSNGIAGFANWTEGNTFNNEKMLEAGKNETGAYASTRYSQRNQSLMMRNALSEQSKKNAHEDIDQAVQEAFAGKGEKLREMREAGGMSTGKRYDKFAKDVMHRAVELQQESQVAENAIAAAKGVQTVNFATALKASSELRARAGGIDPDGAQRSLAGSLKTLSDAHAKNIANLDAIMNHANLDNDMTLALAQGVAQSHNGIQIDATKDAIEAAITRTASGGSYHHMLKLVESLDLSNGPNSVEDHRIAMVEALRKNSARPKFYGFTWLDQITQGIPGGVGVGGVDGAIQSTVNQMKFSADVLVSQDQDVIKRVRETITRRGTGSFNRNSLENLKKQIIDSYSDPQYSGRIAERDPHLRDIMRELDAAGITAEGLSAADEAAARNSVNL